MSGRARILFISAASACCAEAIGVADGRAARLTTSIGQGTFDVGKFTDAIKDFLARNLDLAGGRPDCAGKSIRTPDGMSVSFVTYGWRKPIRVCRNELG